MLVFLLIECISLPLSLLLSLPFLSEQTHPICFLSKAYLHYIVVWQWDRRKQEELGITWSVKYLPWKPKVLNLVPDTYIQAKHITWEEENRGSLSLTVTRVSQAVSWGFRKRESFLKKWRVIKKSMEHCYLTFTHMYIYRCTQTGHTYTAAESPIDRERNEL